VRSKRFAMTGVDWWTSKDLVMSPFVHWSSRRTQSEMRKYAVR